MGAVSIDGTSSLKGKIMSTRVLCIVAAVLLFLTGCSGAGDDDDATTPPEATPVVTPTATPEPTPTATPEPTPTATPEPTPTATPEPSNLLNWNITLLDYSSKAPLSGAQLTVGNVIAFTDSEGKVSFQVEPNAVAELKAELKGYLDLYVYEPFGEVGLDSTIAMLSNATIKQLSLLLGIPYDANKAIVEVALYELTDSGPYTHTVANTTVNLDVPYDVALALDVSSPYGLSAGNTTLEGSDSTITFVNATPGATAIQLDVPEGFSCDRTPGSINSHPGAYTSVAVFCDRL